MNRRRIIFNKSTRIIFNKSIYSACFLVLSIVGIQNHSLADNLDPVLREGKVSSFLDLQVEKLDVGDDAVPDSVVENREINPDTLGVLNETNGGVSKNYWARRSHKEVANTLKQLNISTKSRAYNKFLERLILSTTNIPAPEKESQWGKIIDIRIKKLINAGRFYSAVKLINTLPAQYGADLYGKEIVEMGLVDFNNASVCLTLNKQSKQNLRLDFWRITDLICSVIAGEKADVDSKLSKLKSQKVLLPAGLESLIAMSVDGTEITRDVKISINPWSLNLMRMLGYGIEVPDELDSIYIKRGLLFNTGVDAYERVLLAEEMFATSAIDVKTLHAIYASVPDTYQFAEKSINVDVKTAGKDKNKAGKKLNVSKSKTVVPLGFQRMKAYKAVEKSSTLRNKLLAVKQVYDNAILYSDKIETLYIFAPMFENIKPVSGWQGEKVARMFYAVGDFKQGLKWALKNEEALWHELALAERVSFPRSAIKFKKSGGISTDVDGENTVPSQEGTGIFSNISSDEKIEADSTLKIDDYVNASSLAQDENKRNVWMQFIKKKYGKENTDVGGRRMTQAFLSLEALGYTITVAEWIQAASMSGYVQEMAFSPAKIRVLNILFKRASDPVQILLAVRPFIEQSEIGDEEFSKIVSVLYRSGYGEVAQRMALERLAYHDW